MPEIKYNGLRKNFAVYQIEKLGLKKKNGFNVEAEIFNNLFIDKTFKTITEAENALDEFLENSFEDEFGDEPILPTFTILPLYIIEK